MGLKFAQVLTYLALRNIYAGGYSCRVELVAAY